MLKKCDFNINRGLYAYRGQEGLMEKEYELRLVTWDQLLIPPPMVL